MVGSEGFLTLTIKMRVRPEPECEEELVDLLKRYRDALNHSVEKIVEKRATSLSKVHALLYRELKEAFYLPSRIAMDCYREALSIAKSWLSNPNKGTMPKAKTLRQRQLCRGPGRLQAKNSRLGQEVRPVPQRRG
jgi:putative transposase